MNGNGNRIKTVNKSQHWHKHGTHSVDIGRIRESERQKIQKLKSEMHDSVKKVFERQKRKTS